MYKFCQLNSTRPYRRIWRLLLAVTGSFLFAPLALSDGISNTAWELTRSIVTSTGKSLTTIVQRRINERLSSLAVLSQAFSQLGTIQEKDFGAAITALLGSDQDVMNLTWIEPVGEITPLTVRENQFEQTADKIPLKTRFSLPMLGNIGTLGTAIRGYPGITHPSNRGTPVTLSDTVILQASDSMLVARLNYPITATKETKQNRQQSTNFSEFFQAKLNLSRIIERESESWMPSEYSLRVTPDQVNQSFPRSFQFNSNSLIGGVLFLSLSLPVLFVYFYRRINRARLAEQQTTLLEENQIRYRAVIDCATDAIITIDDKGQILTFNKAAEAIFGYDSAEIIGQSVSALMPDTDRIHHDGHIKSYISTGESKVIGKGRDLTGIRKDGSSFPLKLTVKEMTINGQIQFTGIVRDVSESQISSETQNRLLSILETSPDFIATFDLEGNISFINQAGREILGFENNEDLSNKSLAGLFPQSEIDKLLNEAVPTAYMQKSWIGETMLITIDGKTVTVSQLILLHRSEAGKSPYFSTFMRDISDYKRIQEELQQAKEAAEAAAATKSEFLATMSHEIRTPMNGILGMAQLLQNTSLNKEQYEYVETITQSGNSLLTIINDILDFSKVEAGKMELEYIPFDLERAIYDVYQLLTPRAAEKDLEMIIYYPLECPKQLIGDPGRIRQILMNLVGNAIKFTEQGHILSKVSFTRQQGSYYRIHIDVEDTGIGIDSSTQAKLFQSFTQADSSTTRKHGGTGLGLAICRNLVELMGGKIGIISELNKGTTFGIDLTLEKAPLPDLVPNAQLRDVKALIIDCSRITLRILKEQMESFNMRVSTAICAKEALDEIEHSKNLNQRYELILVDSRVRDMDLGELAAACISADVEYRARLVMISSAAHKGDANYYKQLGYSGYLPKPIFSETLHRTLSGVLSAKSVQSNEPVFVTKHTVAEAEKALSEAHYGFKGTVLLVEDNTVNQKVASSMLKKLNLDVIIANNGQEAVDILQTKRVDIVFMDCQMPIMDGYEATRQIRNLEGNEHRTPIIALTANALSSDRAKCFECGMDDFLAKPFKYEELTNLLANWLESTCTEPANTKQEENMDGNIVLFEQENQIIDMAQLENLRNIMDAKDFSQLIPTFLASTQQQLDDLAAACRNNHVVEIERLAHSIKSSCANLGAMCLSSLARDLENFAKRQQINQTPYCLEAMRSELERVQQALKNRAI